MKITGVPAQTAPAVNPPKNVTKTSIHRPHSTEPNGHRNNWVNQAGTFQNCEKQLNNCVSMVQSEEIQPQPHDTRSSICMPSNSEVHSNFQHPQTIDVHIQVQIHIKNFKIIGMSIHMHNDLKQIKESDDAHQSNETKAI